MPPLAEGDYVVFHDTGANSLALWSRHCSRLVPPVYSYTRDAAGAAETSEASHGWTRRRSSIAWYPEPSAFLQRIDTMPISVVSTSRLPDASTSDEPASLPKSLGECAERDRNVNASDRGSFPMWDGWD